MAATQEEMIQRLLAFIAAADASDDEFGALALELFAYQFEHNAPYRLFCRGRAQTLRTVKRWQDIPAVPISAFKELTLSCCDPNQAASVFMTSGTTRGGVRGKSFHPDLRVYDASMLRNFRKRVMPAIQQMRTGVLFPTEQEMPNSSLAHYLALAIEHCGTPDSRYLLNDTGVDIAGLRADLDAACRAREPYALLGASYSFVQALDALHDSGQTFHLPPGSLIMDTGGFKGQSRELALDEFYDRLASTFGVPRERCINMYGMTELSSQFYDNGNQVCPATKSAPHWMRTRVVNPLSGEDVPHGTRGVLAHCDLAHFNIACTILTEDAGMRVDDGFLLLGRADGENAKGCSLAVEEFLDAAQVQAQV
ncbi:MAG: hypothetical protein ACI8W7_000221 [Gammaproteobacteria bacterium]